MGSAAHPVRPIEASARQQYPWSIGRIQGVLVAAVALPQRRTRCPPVGLVIGEQGAVPGEARLVQRCFALAGFLGLLPQARSAHHGSVALLHDGNSPPALQGGGEELVFRIAALPVAWSSP